MGGSMKVIRWFLVAVLFLGAFVAGYWGVAYLWFSTAEAPLAGILGLVLCLAGAVFLRLSNVILKSLSK